jgi:hypothetical protein
MEMQSKNKMLNNNNQPACSMVTNLKEKFKKIENQ